MRESHIYVPSHAVYLPMACRCCGAQSVRLVIDLGEQPLCNRLVKPDAPIGSEPVYPLRLGYCESCTLMQIDHTIPRDDMFRDYVYVSGTTDTLRKHFAATTERLAATYEIRPHDLVVDIGSNDGTWLEQWAARGVGVYGVDPAVDAAAVARAKGIVTLPSYFDEDLAVTMRDRGGAVKLITSAGSFFHMEDLHGACEGVKRLLAPDGVFVCQAISGADMIHGNAFDQVLHEHLCYYTPRSFGALMARHGLQLFHTLHHTIHGGTVEYHVRHIGGRIQLEPPNWFDVTFDDCAAFAHRVVRLRDNLLSVLEIRRSLGLSVWAYGAPGKGATLLNSFGIGRDLVQCAVEKNPLKFGLSVPGCRIPIHAENTLPDGSTMLRPDAYLVLAWNFLPEFLEKERAYLDAGGQFIVPVPNVRVIGGRVGAQSVSG